MEKKTSNLEAIKLQMEQLSEMSKFINQSLENLQKSFVTVSEQDEGGTKDNLNILEPIVKLEIDDEAINLKILKETMDEDHLYRLAGVGGLNPINLERNSSLIDLPKVSILVLVFFLYNLWLRTRKHSR